VFLSVNIPRIIVKGAGQVNPYMSLESNQSNKKRKKDLKKKISSDNYTKFFLWWV